MDPEKEKVQFATAYGHFFGLAAVVVNFNRVFELLIVVSRRIVHAVTCQYFGDVGTLQFIHHNDSEDDIISAMCYSFVVFVNRAIVSLLRNISLPTFPGNT